MTAKRWRGRWVADFTLDGKRTRRVSPVQTRKGAEAFEAQLRSAWSSSTDCSGPSPRLRAFAIEWLTQRVMVVNKPSDRLRKESILRVHLLPAFGERRLDAITAQRVANYTADKQASGLKASTINGHLAVLRALLGCAVEWGRLDAVPKMRTLKVPPPQFDWLRPQESARLLGAVDDPQWSAVFTLALRTGMRRGEVFALRWADVDLERRRVHVRSSLYRGRLSSTKSNRNRALPLTGDVIAALQRWRERSLGEFVFPGADGRPRRSLGLANRRLTEALERVGLRRVRFHDLRHSFASQLVRHRQPLREVQALLGHSTITMTERYAHVGDDQLAEAVAVLDLVPRGRIKSPPPAAATRC